MLYRPAEFAVAVTEKRRRENVNTQFNCQVAEELRHRFPPGCVNLISRPGYMTVWFLVTILTVLPVMADNESKCYRIDNSDQRIACLAEARGSSSRCYSIKDVDRKQLCVARTRGDKSRCYLIHDKDLRVSCLAGMN